MLETKVAPGDGQQQATDPRLVVTSSALSTKDMKGSSPALRGTCEEASYNVEAKLPQLKGSPLESEEEEQEVFFGQVSEAESKRISKMKSRRRTMIQLRSGASQALIAKQQSIAAARIQAWFRACHCRRVFLRHRRAAIDIQRWYRRACQHKNKRECSEDAQSSDRSQGMGMKSQRHREDVSTTVLMALPAASTSSTDAQTKLPTFRSDERPKAQPTASTGRPVSALLSAKRARLEELRRMKQELQNQLLSCQQHKGVSVAAVGTDSVAAPPHSQTTGTPDSKECSEKGSAEERGENGSTRAEQTGLRQHEQHDLSSCPSSPPAEQPSTTGDVTSRPTSPPSPPSEQVGKVDLKQRSACLLDRLRDSTSGITPKKPLNSSTPASDQAEPSKDDQDESSGSPTRTRQRRAKNKAMDDISLDADCSGSESSTGPRRTHKRLKRQPMLGTDDQTDSSASASQPRGPRSSSTSRFALTNARRARSSSTKNMLQRDIDRATRMNTLHNSEYKVQFRLPTEDELRKQQELADRSDACDDATDSEAIDTGSTSGVKQRGASSVDGKGDAVRTRGRRVRWAQTLEQFQTNDAKDRKKWLPNTPHRARKVLRRQRKDTDAFPFADESPSPVAVLPRLRASRRDTGFSPMAASDFGGEDVPSQFDSCSPNVSFISSRRGNFM